MALMSGPLVRISSDPIKLLTALALMAAVLFRADAVSGQQPEAQLAERLEKLVVLAEGEPRAALTEIEDITANYPLNAAERIKLLAVGSMARSRLGDNERALEDGKEATRLFGESGLADDHELNALSLFATARAHDNLGHAAEALSRYYDAWSIYRNLGDDAGMAMAHTGGARIYNEIGQHDRALSNYRIALGRAERADDLFLRVRILNNIAFTLIQLGRPDEALTTLDEADQLNERLQSKLLGAFLIDNRGGASFEAGRFEEAERYLLESLRLGQEVGVDALISGAHYDIARLRLMNGDLVSARDHAERALAISDQNRERGRVRDILSVLAEVNAAAGRHEESYRQLRESYAIRDAIADDATRQLAAVLEAQSALERKEQEIALLQRDRRIDALQLERERELRNAGAIGIGILLILIMVLVWLLRARARATREAEMRSRELMETHRALEAANRAKSDFLAMTSHEVRTPLNGIMGMTQVLMRSSLPEEHKQRINTIHQSAELLLALLNDILDMSKIEAGRIDIRPNRFDLAGMLDGVMALWRQRAADRNLGLALEVSADLPHFVMGDAGRLRQILNNLISNALKFTARGRVRIAVSRDPDGQVRFAVSDTGIGISESDQGLIFEPFMQAQSGATREYGGTGLGLSICRNLINLMGGEIGFVSEQGKGSTFWFSLPLPEAEGPVPVKADVRRIAALPGTVPGDRSRPLVLIADDNEMNRIVMREMLHNQNYDLAFAVNGQEAVEAVIRDHPDLVLMDVHMPEMGGIEAVGRIRALGGPLADLPVIAITADAMEGDREHILKAGMNDYISKPIDRLSLLGMIDCFLGRPRRAEGRRVAVPAG